MDMGFPFGAMQKFQKQIAVVVAQYHEYILFYTLNMCSLLNFNYTSVKIYNFEKIYLFIVRARGRVEERLGETHQCNREKYQPVDVGEKHLLVGCLSYTPGLGTKPAAKACALTQNRTSNLSLWGTMPNHTSWSLSEDI